MLATPLLPIMPKDTRHSSGHENQRVSAPYPQLEAPSSSNRATAIWSAADDAVLLRARASGLNWQPIAARHFPNKTANACRKRHERLVERRQAEDWDTQKLELLAQEYMICRRQMWETLAAKLGERWNVVEAKVRPAYVNAEPNADKYIVHGERSEEPAVHSTHCPSSCFCQL